jgi:hypothetical protein
MLLVSALLAVTAAVASFVLSRPPRPDRASATPADFETRLRTACSSCHLFPPPEILPRASWRGQIEHMAFLTDYVPGASSGPEVAFSVEEIVAWYEARAPERLDVEMALASREPPPLRFRRRFAHLGPESGPGVGTVRRIEADLLGDGHPLVAAPNMMTGSVHLFSLFGGPHRIGTAAHPVRVVAGDLDRDGLEDLVISDLGDPMPTDEPVGRVLVARNAGGGSFELEAALEGVGRVADARPLDLDADGDLDIAVASFGWLRRGGIYVLRNETPRGGDLALRVEPVSDRAGAVSIVPTEGLWQGAGRGFAVAFAQQHEQISAFHPTREGYEERILYRAPHPNWGTSTIEPVDLDGDGDVDFLLAHGDTLDDGVAFKPYHGVEWLENLGAGEFRARRIGGLYGAHGVLAGDLDGDGDLDVVACGFLPQVQLPVPERGMRVDSLIWFERRAGDWIPWSIELDHPRHTGLSLVDLNADGRLDIVASVNRAWDIESIERGPSLEIWFNEGPR